MHTIIIKIAQIILKDVSNYFIRRFIHHENPLFTSKVNRQHNTYYTVINKTKNLNPNIQLRQMLPHTQFLIIEAANYIIAIHNDSPAVNIISHYSDMRVLALFERI